MVCVSEEFKALCINDACAVAVKSPVNPQAMIGGASAKHRHLVRRFAARIAAAIAMAATFSFSPSAVASDVVTIGGTGAAMTIVRQLGETFSAQSGIAIKVLPSLGSGGGLRAIADGVIDIAVAARPLNAEESAKGLRPAFSAKTPFGFVTSKSSPQGFRIAEIANAMLTANAAWPDGTPLRFILRPRSDSDTWVMAALSPEMAKALEFARTRPDISVAGSDDDNASLAESMPGSLTGATYVQVATEKRRLHFVPIDGVMPTPQSFESGQYPLSKTLYFIVRGDPSDAAARFLAFLCAPEAERVMRGVGLVLTKAD